MIFSILYFILAVIGLGLLVFIHELGHYWMARKVGMKVEVFSIGFGRPLYSWERDKVKWQVCVLPFGGYVKIAGMQKENGVDPHQNPEGFFGKKPFDRIKVAAMGPIVNIVFAFLAFTLLWVIGGREKRFAEFTHKIGWVEENSPLYGFGVRPGDEVVQYDGKKIKNFTDIRYASILNDEKTEIGGYKIDYFREKRLPFEYRLENYEDYASPLQARTIGLGSPASYLLYDKFSSRAENPLPAWSPLLGSGIQYKDRLFWVNGEIVFSFAHLRDLISSSDAFLTVERDGRIFHAKMPRVKMEELKLSPAEKAEIDDWQHELGMKGDVGELVFFPFLFSSDNVVQKRLEFIDEEMQKKTFLSCQRCPFFYPLRAKDKILAIDGVPVQNAYQLLKNLQKKASLIIVQRESGLFTPISWRDQDQEFDQMLDLPDLQKIVDRIGTNQPLEQSGRLQLLKPVVPVTFEEIPASMQKERMLKEIEASKKEIDKIEDPQKRKEVLKTLEREYRQEYLGINLQDRMVNYNPSPIEEFFQVCQGTWRTLGSLISGYLSPKWLSGPVGMVTAVQRSWFLGGKEALFWLAVVSLNLGIANLLPIPVLDGGYILFSLFEICTRRKISPKTMERLIVPFVILIIGFFLYVTYHDIARLFSRFF